MFFHPAARPHLPKASTPASPGTSLLSIPKRRPRASWLIGLILALPTLLCGAGCERGAGLTQSPRCAEYTCYGHGECHEDSGKLVCECEPEYSGEYCNSCAEGYQDKDDDGSCLPSCAEAHLDCGEHGECDDSDGTAHCLCHNAYGGEECGSCAEGYQDNDGDGSCLPSCDTAAFTCNGHGECDDSDGTAGCLCDPGYTPTGDGGCQIQGTGESCDDPVPLPLTSALTVIDQDNHGTGDDTEGACVSETAGNDRVYLFEIPTAVRLHVETSGYDTVAYLRTVCEDPATELACDDDHGPGRGSLLDLDVEAGSYYLVVDSYSDPGDYQLRVTLDCGEGLVFDPGQGACIADPCHPNPCTETNRHACVPQLPDAFACECDPGFVEEAGACVADPLASGETCSDPMALTSDTGSLAGDTSSAPQNHEGTCAGEGPENIYTFTLTEPKHVDFIMQGYDTVGHLRTVCDAVGSQLACTDDSAPNHGSRIIGVLGPGVYFLFVDSYNSPGPYTLDYTMRPDPCADEAAACPGTPECLANYDWTSYRCVCPEGELPHQDTCVPDPCSPKPCTEPFKGRCEPQLPASYTCTCDAGYWPQPSDPSVCEEDPDAAEWLVMVYLDADNNLEMFAQDDIDEMVQAGHHPEVSVVVLLDTYYSGGGTGRLLEVGAGGAVELDDWGEVDMSDWRTLRDFGVWAVDAYPARSHALIVWDHGDGWKLAPTQNPLHKGFCSDDHGSPGAMSISNGDYASAMAPIVAAKGSPLDLVGFDACLMGMWEVAAATAPFSRFLVASSETIPGPGWSYDAFLGDLVADPDMSAEALGTSIIDSYHAESSSNSTLALSDLSTVGSLAVALSSLADALAAHPSRYPDWDNVRAGTLSFSGQPFYDIGALALTFAGMSSAPTEVTVAAQGVVNALNLTVVYNVVQSDYDDSHGLSIYWPDQGTSMDSDYQASGAVWAEITTWDEFLSDFAGP